MHLKSTRNKMYPVYGESKLNFLMKQERLHTLFAGVPSDLLPAVFSLNPQRAKYSITVFLFTSFPQKDNITGIQNLLFFPEGTTLTSNETKKKNGLCMNTAQICSVWTLWVVNNLFISGTIWTTHPSNLAKLLSMT